MGILLGAATAEKTDETGARSETGNKENKRKKW